MVKVMVNGWLTLIDLWFHMVNHLWLIVINGWLMDG